MKSKPVDERLAGGVDQRWKTSTNNASNIKNCRVEEQGLGWVNDRGWEPLIMSPVGTTTLPLGLGDIPFPTRFLKVWTRHNGGEVYYIYERNGKLKYDFGNTGGASVREVILKEGRNQPKANDIGTQLIAYSRFALIMNGFDRPFKFWGRGETTDFGWSQPPNAPNVFDPNPEAREEGMSVMDEGDVCFYQSSSTRTVGMGNSADNEYSTYKYKVSYISDTGSESPLSASVAQTWKVDNAAQEGYYSCFLTNIPVGPKGTVARRIYRTKNLENNAAEVYYFVKQLNDNSVQDWLDIIKDSLLLAEAPDGNASIILPQSFKVGGNWNGCMWLAGGSEISTKIHYSDRYLPEQFNRFRFFDVGGRTGGAVTALVPYSNNLVVFRENSIEAISAIADDEYTISTITADVGTRATNTIVEVPSVGLFFLTNDGVYALTGGQAGAGLVQLQCNKVSAGLHKEWKRLSESSLARATATYSKREKEYWVHYPVDGDTENSRGAVYHSQNNSWSLRNLSDPKYQVKTNLAYGMYFTHLDVDPEGWTIIGTYPNYPYTSASVSEFVGFPGYGLQVWSAAPMFGHWIDWTSTTQTENYTVNDASKRELDCIYETVFDDLGDDSVKKRVLSVEVEMVTQGYNDIQLSYRSDYVFNPTDGGGASAMTVEKYKTINSEPVWTLADPGDVKNLAEWGDPWSGDQLCRVRWDIHTGLVGATSWRIHGINKFHIISYHIEYMDGKQKVITHRGSDG